MARKKQRDGESQSHANAGDNGSIKNFLTSIDDVDDELASLQGKYRAACKGPRNTLKELMAEVKDAGHNMKAFRVLLKKHRDDRKHQKRVAGLEQEDADDFEAMAAALGDYGSTPLGQHALDQARARSGDDTLDTLQQ